jgi:hypothetical protein
MRAADGHVVTVMRTAQGPAPDQHRKVPLKTRPADNHCQTCMRAKVCLCAGTRKCGAYVGTCVCVCLRGCVRACMRVRTHTCVCAFARGPARMGVCVCVCE